MDKNFPVAFYFVTTLTSTINFLTGGSTLSIYVTKLFDYDKTKDDNGF